MNCVKKWCGSCKKDMGGCYYSEAMIDVITCPSCVVENAYGQCQRMSEMNKKLRAMGLAFDPKDEE